MAKLALLTLATAAVGCATFPASPLAAQAPGPQAPPEPQSQTETAGHTESEPAGAGQWTTVVRQPHERPARHHGPVFGLMGSYRVAPPTRTEAVGLQLGYHLDTGQIDHALTVTAGLAIGSGNCGTNNFGGRLAYSFLGRVHGPLVTGAELALYGFDQERCHREADGDRFSQHVLDAASVAWLIGARFDPLFFGVSPRLGLGPMDESFDSPGGPPGDGGGTLFTIDLGLWVQLRL